MHLLIKRWNFADSFPYGVIGNQQGIMDVNTTGKDEHKIYNKTYYWCFTITFNFITN